MTGDISGCIKAFKKLAGGSFIGIYGGSKYLVILSNHANGKSQKLYAKQLGGADHVSLNIYHLESGSRLYPFEMPVEKVARFIKGVRPLQ